MIQQTFEFRAQAHFDHRHAWIDAGTVGEPLRITDADLRAMSREQLAELEANALSPGFEVYRIEGGPWPEIEIRWTVPCVTALPADAR